MKSSHCEKNQKNSSVKAFATVCLLNDHSSSHDLWFFPQRQIPQPIPQKKKKKQQQLLTTRRKSACSSNMNSNFWYQAMSGIWPDIYVINCHNVTWTVMQWNPSTQNTLMKDHSPNYGDFTITRLLHTAMEINIQPQTSPLLTPPMPENMRWWYKFPLKKNIHIFWRKV